MGEMEDCPCVVRREERLPRLPPEPRRSSRPSRSLRRRPPCRPRFARSLCAPPGALPLSVPAILCGSLQKLYQLRSRRMGVALCRFVKPAPTKRKLSVRSGRPVFARPARRRDIQFSIALLSGDMTSSCFSSSVFNNRFQQG
jgi:hypothetical protein